MPLRSLEEDILFLGLPTGPEIQKAGANSSSNVAKISARGWEFPAHEATNVDALWDTDHPDRLVYATTSPRSDARFMISHLRQMRRKYLTMSAARQPARISSRYDLRNDSSQKDIPVEANLLKICLHYVSIENDKEREEAGDRDYDLKWEPHGTIHIDYLEPDLNSYFDGPDNLAKIRAVVHLLCFTNPEEESTAAQLVGSALTDIFCVERTDIISDQTLILPKVFWPTKADTVTPLDNPDVRAQMADALHPTMILLVLAHYHNIGGNGLEEIRHPPMDKQTRFGEKSMVYGLAYDKEQLTILSHFPQLHENNDGTHSIRFFQVPVAGFKLARAARSLLRRWRMVVALFTVLKHAEMLREVLTPLVARYKSSASPDR